MDRERLLSRAKITYFFKETFRAHSQAEYREVLSRGLNDNNGGITRAFPWLYVRVFFALFMLFTANVLILRLTNNTLYVPSVTFLGGVTFIIPLVVLLYELYPRRDLSLIVLFTVLVIGGVLSGGLTQLGYAFIDVNNQWLLAVVAGILEEICKIIPAIIAIEFTKQKNPYACYLLAAAVGAGFSVIEDMGYIFYYVDFHSDIQSTVAVFVDRGISTFFTHILWTGAVGWAYSLKKPFRSVWLVLLALSTVIHICWDLPLEGWLHVINIIVCSITALSINVAIVHKTRVTTLYKEVDIERVNDNIIAEAKAMGERMRFTNAANLTFALTCAMLSVIILILCALPIGMEYQRVEYQSKEEFIAYVQGGYNLKADRGRQYKPNGYNIEERFIEGELSYVVQKDVLDGFDGEYYYGYYASDRNRPDSISVELEAIPGRVFCEEYVFDKEKVWAFTVCTDLINYTYNADGTVTAVTDAEEFEGYDVLIALVATACAITAGCAVVLTAFRIKLRRVRDDIQ